VIGEPPVGGTSRAADPLHRRWVSTGLLLSPQQDRSGWRQADPPAECLHRGVRSPAGLLRFDRCHRRPFLASLIDRSPSARGCDLEQQPRFDPGARTASPSGPLSVRVRHVLRLRQPRRQDPTRAAPSSPPRPWAARSPGDAPGSRDRPKRWAVRDDDPDRAVGDRASGASCDASLVLGWALDSHHDSAPADLPGSKGSSPFAPTIAVRPMCKAAVIQSTVTAVVMGTVRREDARSPRTR
jgi:hypothetical protein